jgi:hypothetical protein
MAGHEHPERADKSLTITESTTVPIKRDWVDYVGLGISVILVGITFFGVLAAWRGLPELIRQTAATKNAANAAKESAEAALKQANIMASAERAWVVETVVFLNTIPRRGASWHGGVMTANLSLKNIGRQPAVLRFVQDRFHTAARLPKEPQYHRTGGVPDGFLLTPGEERHWRCALEEGSLEDEQIDHIETGSTLSLYIYGRITYTSMGITGTNQFCYKWENLMGFALEGDKPGFRKDGPSGYNSHT